MTTQETPVTENTVPVEETPEPKKSFLNPRLKKALIWVGAGVGTLAVVVLAAAAFKSEDEEELLELDVYTDDTPFDVIEIAEVTD